MRYKATTANRKHRNHFLSNQNQNSRTFFKILSNLCVSDSPPPQPTLQLSNNFYHNYHKQFRLPFEDKIYSIQTSVIIICPNSNSAPLLTTLTSGSPPLLFFFLWRSDFNYFATKKNIFHFWPIFFSPYSIIITNFIASSQ